MILGMSTYTFTVVHTVLSLVALVSGIVVLINLLGSRSSGWWTPLYLVTSVATSVTGFGFPFDKLLPSHILGILSLILLLLAILACYVYGMAGAWRWIFVVSIAISVYFLAFVTVVQAFLKVAALHALAPNGSEPPFAVAQIAVLIVFLALSVAALRKFHPAMQA